jgi:hypothetical protein
MSTPKSEIYEALSRTRIRVNDHIFENEIHISVRQTLLDGSDRNSIVGIEILSFTQTAADGFSLLLEDLNALNQHLIFEIDAEGNVLQINNFHDLPNRWAKVKTQLQEKYGASNEMDEFCKTFEQSLNNSDLLVTSMKHKGIYGVLFSGLNLSEYQQNNNFQRFRYINPFIDNIELPLLIQSEVTSVLDNHEAYRCVNSSGRLDEGRFDSESFKQTMRNMTNRYQLEADLNLTCGEMYAFRQTDGWLSKAQQYLRVDVSDAYEYEIGWLLMLK